MLLRGTSRDVRELRETVSRINELGQIRGGFLDPDVQGKIEVLYAQITSTTQTSGRYPASLYTADSQATTWTDTGDTCWLVPPNGEALSTGTVYAVNLREVLDSDGLAVYTVMGGLGAATTRTGFAPVRVVCFNLAAYSRSGNVITASANGALASIDGISLSVGDRLLFVKNYGDTSYVDNGIYEVTTLGDGSNPFVLTRASDADATSDFVDGYTVCTKYGSFNGGQIWQLLNHPGDLPVDLNNTELWFILNASPGSGKLADYVTTSLPGGFSRSSDYQVLTESSNGALGTIDGHVMAANDILLYAPASDSADAGLYTVTQVGDLSNPWKLTRRGEFDHAAKLRAGTTIFVQFGTTYSNSIWRQRHSFGPWWNHGNSMRFDRIA